MRRKELNTGVKLSPLVLFEPQLVELIKCMGKIKRSLTLTEGLHLYNQLISCTEIQGKLIEYKISRYIYVKTTEDLGKVGRHYLKDNVVSVSIIPPEVSKDLKLFKPTINCIISSFLRAAQLKRQHQR